MDFGSLLKDMTMGNVIGGLIFSGVGTVAFMYGKKQGEVRPMVLGAVLVVYPYFVSNTALMFLIGTALTAALSFKD
jgi:hypothetical protein